MGKRRAKYLTVKLLIIAALLGGGNWGAKKADQLGYFDWFHAYQSGKPVLRVRLLNQWPRATLKEFGPLEEVLAEKYYIKETSTDRYDVVIDGVFGNQPILNPKAYKIFFTGEAAKAKTDGYDLSLGFDYLNHPRYLRLPLYYVFYRDKVTTAYKRGPCNPNGKKFACFLVSNSGASDPKRFDGAIARNVLFKNLSTYKKVESGGRYLNNIGKVVAPEETFQWLQQCKFVIAYENTTHYPGYITEKVFQAYLAGAIPIYNGNREAVKDINKEAIIYSQDFEKDQDLMEYIKVLDQDDDKYCKVWNASLLTDPKRNYEVIKAQLREKLGKLLS